MDYFQFNQVRSLHHEAVLTLPGGVGRGQCRGSCDSGQRQELLVPDGLCEKPPSNEPVCSIRLPSTWSVRGV